MKECNLQRPSRVLVRALIAAAIGRKGRGHPGFRFVTAQMEHTRAYMRGDGIIPPRRKPLTRMTRNDTHEKSMSRPVQRLPNFFVLGAAKCGTTSLHGYLRQHPEIHMSAVKEPSFFCREFQVVRNPIDYLKLFECGEERTAVGEASHVYFSNPDTPSALRALFPEAKFILILRNPTLRSHSLYQFMRKLGYEKTPTFEQALVEEDRRFSDPAFRTDCPQYFWNFMYYRSSLYDEQLQRYFDRYDRNRFFILSLSELATNPRLWMEKIFDFLSVSPQADIDYTPLNVSRYANMAGDTRSALDRRFAPMVKRLQALVGRPLDLASR